MVRTSLLFVALFCLGCGRPSVSETPPASVSTPNIEDVPLMILDYDGIIQRIASNKGKVVVMDAWSTSCEPCMREFPKLVALRHKYDREQLACISLSFDYEGIGKPQDVQPRVLAFLQAQGAVFDNILSSDESDVLYRKFKLAAVPAVFVYDRSGKLRKRFDNEQAKSKAEAFTYEQVGALVAELIAEPDSQPPAAEATEPAAEAK